MKLGSSFKRKIARSVFLVPLLLIFSCFTYQEYPSEWEPLQTSTADCIDISGVYSNIGEAGATKLSHFLLPDTGDQFVTAVEIVLISNEKLKIIGWNENVLTDEKVVPKGSGFGFFGLASFKCDSGRIKIFVGTSRSRDQTGFINRKETCYLSRSTAGDLTLEGVYLDSGCCLFVPFMGGGSVWHRYEPVVKEKNEGFKELTYFNPQSRFYDEATIVFIKLQDELTK